MPSICTKKSSDDVATTAGMNSVRHGDSGGSFAQCPDKTLTFVSTDYLGKRLKKPVRRDSLDVKIYLKREE